MELPIKYNKIINQPSKFKTFIQPITSSLLFQILSISYTNFLNGVNLKHHIDKFILLIEKSVFVAQTSQIFINDLILKE